MDTSGGDGEMPELVDDYDSDENNHFPLPVTGSATNTIATPAPTEPAHVPKKNKCKRKTFAVDRAEKLSYSGISDYLT
jgi:hypothetical protein